MMRLAPPGRTAGTRRRARRAARLALAATAVALILCGCRTASPDPADDAAEPAREQATADQSDHADASPASDAEAADEGPLTLAEFNKRWTDLLRPAVDRRTGGVDYRKLQAEHEPLAQLQDALAPARDFDTDAQRLAFLLNAYNLLVIAAVVDQPRLPATVRDIREFFTDRRHRLLGDRYSLDDIRDQLIRPLGEPRAHFALANGAIGGPLVLHVAYTPHELDAQLDYQQGRFLTDPVRNTVIGPTVMLSPLFRWFTDDFEAAASDGTLTGYLRARAPEGSRIADQLDRDADPPIDFLDFNWALNHVPTPDLPPDEPAP